MRMIPRRKIGWSVAGKKTRYFYNSDEWFTFTMQISRKHRYIVTISYNKNIPITDVKDSIDFSLSPVYTTHSKIVKSEGTESWYDGTVYYSLQEAFESLLRSEFQPTKNNEMIFFRRFNDDNLDKYITIKPYTLDCHPEINELNEKIKMQGWKRKKYKGKFKRKK